MNSFSPLKYLLFSIAILLPLIVVTQDDLHRQTATGFITALNESRFNEAAAMTTDSFVVRTLYGGKNRYKESYFFRTKNRSPLHPISRIDSTKVKVDYIRVYVTNTSDLVTYIGLPEQPFTYTFLFKKDKIMELQIDTLRGYNASMVKNDLRWESFENWANSKYPGINTTYIKLQYNDSLARLIRIYHDELTKKK